MKYQQIGVFEQDAYFILFLVARIIYSVQPRLKRGQDVNKASIKLSLESSTVQKHWVHRLYTSFGILITRKQDI
jgi:hypothetical protein